MSIIISHLGPSGTPFYSQQGRWKECICDMVFDSSYPLNGYLNNLSPGQFNMLSVVDMSFDSVNGPTSSGLAVQYDRTNKAVLVTFEEPSNPLVIEEAVTIPASGIGRLANVPAYIMAAESRTGSVTGGFTIVPVGSTVSTTQVAVDFTTGIVTTFTTDAVTKLLVTYIPMGSGPFVPANQVIDELVTLPNGSTVNLANQANLVQYVYESTTLKIALPIIGSTNSPAAGQIQIQLANSTNTTITDNSAQNNKVAKVTYWKASAFGAAFGFVDRTSTNTSTNVINYSSAMAAGTLNGTLLNAYGVHHAAYATNTDVPSVAIGPTGTAATATPVLNPITNRITFVGSDSITRESIAYILLNAMNLGTNNGGTRPQVPTGTNLSSYTVRARIVGF
jgi:hypothetical protein